RGERHAGAEPLRDHLVDLVERGLHLAVRRQIRPRRRSVSAVMLRPRTSGQSSQHDDGRDDENGARHCPTSRLVIGRQSRGSAATSMTKVTSDALAVLSGLTYFRPLPAADLRRLAAQSTVRDVRRGQRVFEEGTAAEGLFIVMEGRVRLVRISRGGREQVLHSEGPGATLGEVPLLDGDGYVATAIATEPSR